MAEDDRPADERQPGVQRRFAGHDPSRGADTGGTPWQGRTLTGTGFDDDTGEADAHLRALLARGVDTPDREKDLVAAVAAARLLVPIVAVAADTVPHPDSGLLTDAASDMAAVTLTAPDGARALPVFTGVESLAAWDPKARPVPVTAQRAAQAAVQEGCHVIVLDPPAPGQQRPGNATYALRSSMVWALAMAREWIPAHADPQVAGAVAAAVATEPAVLGHGLSAAADGALQVELELAAGLAEEELRALVTRVGQRVATDGEVRARIDAVGFVLRGG